MKLSPPSKNDVKETRRQDILRQTCLEENEYLQREHHSRDTTYVLRLKYIPGMYTITTLP
jgi:hypothetical protein